MGQGDHGNGGLVDLIKRLWHMCRKLEDLDVEADGIAAALQELLEESQRAPAVAGRKQATTDGIAKAAAQAGVARVLVKRRVDDWATVIVDHYPPLDLPPALADLLDVLCMDSGPGEGGMVGFKPAQEVALLVGARSGRTAGPGAVRNLVWRLRKAIRAAKGNPYWVQGSRWRGYRFALRRMGGDVTGCDAA